ncbi:MAG: hypothetical protein Q8P81_00075 [Nanoarchaeota archaeon]|nr:hypothetical protein [Nanoarchaeota archaeon]
MNFRKYIGIAAASTIVSVGTAYAQNDNRIEELNTKITAIQKKLDANVDGQGELDAIADLGLMFTERDSLLRAQETQLPSTQEETRGIRPQLMAGFHAGQVNGLDLGLQYGPMALTVNYSNSGDEIFERVRGPKSSSGMQGQVRTYGTDYNALGVGLEYNPEGSDAFVGAGLNSWEYDRIREVKITRRDGTVTRDAESQPDSELSANFRAGYKRDLSQNEALRATLNYDTQKGFSASVRFQRRLGK